MSVSAPSSWIGRLWVRVGRVSGAKLQACKPSSCGMLVYKELTSRVTRMQVGGMFPRLDSLFRKCVYSVSQVQLCLDNQGLQVVVHKFRNSLCRSTTGGYDGSTRDCNKSSCGFLVGGRIWLFWSLL